MRINPVDHLIVADEDLLRAFLAMPNADELRNYFPVDPAAVTPFRLIASKHSFIEAALQLGLRVPKYRFAESEDEAVRAAAEIGYPVFLKGERGFAGMQVRRATDKDGVRQYARRFLGLYSRVLVQKEIQGDSVSACAVYDRGRLSALKAFRAQCPYPRDFSPSTVHAYFSHATIADVATRLGNATGFHGLAGIDFMYDCDTDELFVIEFNPRPTIGFGGAAANRRFFAKPVENLIYGNHSHPTEVYDGSEPMQCYFPSYGFYMLLRLKRYDHLALHRLRLTFEEYRRAEWKIVIWESARFFRMCLKRAASAGKHLRKLTR